MQKEEEGNEEWGKKTCQNDNDDNEHNNENSKIKRTLFPRFSSGSKQNKIKVEMKKGKWP